MIPDPIDIVNGFALDSESLLIPWGDHPHARGIQRLTRAAGERMVEAFNSLRGRLGRLFGGLPVYVGHPDDPQLARDYPDRRAYGWIEGMEATADGLALRPKWSRAGQELIENAAYKWFSPRWACAEAGRERNRAVLDPLRLISVGLTNMPNIQGMAPLANEQGKEDAMWKEKLLKLLGLAPEATDEDLDKALDKLAADKAAAEQAAGEAKAANEARAAAEKAGAEAKAAAEAEVSNLKAEIATAKAAVATAQAGQAAERGARIALVLDNAVAAGRITEAQRPEWLKALEGDFAAKSVELANVKPAVKTGSVTADLGKRQPNAAAAERQARVLALVNERIEKTGQSFDQCWAAVRKEQEALFKEMQQPAPRA